MTPRGETLVLGTRGSALARRQAETVKAGLDDRRLSVDLVEVETTGDQLQDDLIHRLGTTGAFVRALDREVLDGDLDGAVHSMKDMPTEQPETLVVAAVLERGPAADVLVTPEGTQLTDLPSGATVGTASLRRGAQLRAARPDLEIEGLRGNVDTRVEKLLAPHLQREHNRRVEAHEVDGSGSEDTDDAVTDSPAGESADADRGAHSPAGETADADRGAQSGAAETADAADGSQSGAGEGPTDETEQADEDHRFDRMPAEWIATLTPIERNALDRSVETEYDAICLAEAGLERSGLVDAIQTERLDSNRFVPAPAQGTIAVVAPDGDVAAQINDAIDHPPTRVAVTVERTILHELGGGCVAPVGIHARLQGDVVSTSVRVLSQDGTDEVGGRRDIPVERHPEAAAAFAADLAEQGAARLIQEARRAEPDEPKRA